MPDMTTSLPEGQTATSKDGNKRMIVRGGVWVTDETFAPAVKAKTAPQDRVELNAASGKAATERDAQRTYGQAAKAVEQMGTGPIKAAFLDAIMPEEDGGALDKLGALLGTPIRALVPQSTLDARDQLKTVNANVALAGSQQMKGSSSDKDTALMRLSGMGPSKGINENRRVIRQATFTSGLEQARALIKAKWIGKHGSLAQPSANGMTFEEALQLTEKNYHRNMRSRSLPKAPPAKRGRVTTIDLDGNPIQ